MQDSTLKDRIWSFDRETEIAQVNRYTEREDYRLLCYSVIDAVIEIREIGEIHSKHIDSFAMATECPFEFVFSCGGKRLMEIAHYSALATERIKTIAKHPQWQPRFNLMCLMSYRPPVPLALELLTLGLADKSAKVASRAAHACDDFGGSEALKLLEVRLPKENRPKVREELEFAIELMHTPPVRNGRNEERTVRGVVIVRPAGPSTNSGK